VVHCDETPTRARNKSTPRKAPSARGSKDGRGHLACHTLPCFMGCAEAASAASESVRPEGEGDPDMKRAITSAIAAAALTVAIAAPAMAAPATYDG
jgi:hypothetical protein